MSTRGYLFRPLLPLSSIMVTYPVLFCLIVLLMLSLSLCILNYADLHIVTRQ